jgi:hypothetical protein
VAFLATAAGKDAAAVVLLAFLAVLVFFAVAMSDSLDRLRIFAEA